MKEVENLIHNLRLFKQHLQNLNNIISSDLQKIDQRLVELEKKVYMAENNNKENI